MEENAYPKGSWMVKSLIRWRPDEVSFWIGSIGLAKYRTLFVDNKVSGARLLQLTREDLCRLDLNKLLRIIAFLKYGNMANGHQEEQPHDHPVSANTRVVSGNSSPRSSDIVCSSSMDDLTYGALVLEEDEVDGAPDSKDKEEEKKERRGSSTCAVTINGSDDKQQSTIQVNVEAEVEGSHLFVSNKHLAKGIQLVEAAFKENCSDRAVVLMDKACIQLLHALQSSPPHQKAIVRKVVDKYIAKVEQEKSCIVPSKLQASSVRDEEKANISPKLIRNNTETSLAHGDTSSYAESVAELLNERRRTKHMIIKEEQGGGGKEEQTVKGMLQARMKEKEKTAAMRKRTQRERRKEELEKIMRLQTKEQREEVMAVLMAASNNHNGNNNNNRRASVSLSWECCFCTFMNERSAQACLMCDQKPSPTHGYALKRSLSQE
ncbi:hypothetical protein QOT17_017004 [Balamuthia mandrillaris]